MSARALQQVPTFLAFSMCDRLYDGGVVAMLA